MEEEELVQKMSFTYQTFYEGKPFEDVTISETENCLNEMYDGSELESLRHFIKKALNSFGFLHFGEGDEIFLEGVTQEEWDALNNYLHYVLRGEEKKDEEIL